MAPSRGCSESTPGNAPLSTATLPWELLTLRTHRRATSPYQLSILLKDYATPAHFELRKRHCEEVGDANVRCVLKANTLCCCVSRYRADHNTIAE